jgi:hypothetical protein
MKEIVGNLWDYYADPANMICITTNGVVKANGEAVCGRGCAREATQRIPGFARLLGNYIQEHGNVPGFMQVHEAEDYVFIYPVKHKWFEKASPNLILAAAHVLFDRAQANPSSQFILPRPGCGNGGLKWWDVKPLIEFLPDNVLVISKG